MNDADPHDDLRRSDRGPQARGEGGVGVIGAEPHASGNRSDETRRRQDGDEDDAPPGGKREREDKGKDSDTEDKDKEDKDENKDKDKRGDKDDDKKEDKPSPLSKTWVKVVIAIVVVLVLIGAGVWFYRYWTHGRFVQDTNDAYLQTDEVVVSSKVSGSVEEVFVTDNQQVHAGDRLARIDSRSYRARVDQAKAQAAQGRATVAQYEAQIDEQRAAILQALAAVAGAEAQRRYYQGEVDRYTPLVRTGAEPAERLSQVTANRDQAVATLRQNQASALQARRRVTTLAAQIGVARAQVSQAEAEARQGQVDLDSTLITAGVDGRVGDRQVRVGLEVQVGTRLLTLVPVHALYLVANFKETQIRLMRIGQPATLKVDALGGAEVSGEVESFSPGTGAQFALIPANNATGNFTKIVQRVPVRIRVEAGEEARKVLVPGLSVEVSVDTLGSKAEAVRLDDEAKQDADRRKQTLRDGVERDRQQPASGAGR